MKLRLLSLMAAAMLVSVPAVAQTRLSPADQLNQRQLDMLQAQRAAQVATPAPTPTINTGMVESVNPLAGFYVGAMVGSTLRKNDQVDTGINMGYMFNKNVDAEITYDVNFRNQGRDGHAVMVNGIYQRGIVGTPVTPYILAGVGMGMGNWITAPNENITGLYNVGGGVKYAVARNVDLDLRYRYMASWNTPGYHANVVTAGIQYRF